MCEQLDTIRTVLCRFAAAFDPELATVEQAVGVVAGAAAIEASAAALKALAASRAAEAGAYRSSGERSSAEGLASAIGIGSGAAREVITTGRRLREHRELAAAATSGNLSAEKVALVAGASAADPTAAAALLELAPGSSLASLRDECARVKASVGNAEERRRAIHARRSLRSWTDVEGVWHLSAAGNPEDGAQVMAALAPRIEEHFRAARAAGRHESPAAYAFDALVDLGRDAASSDRGTSAGECMPAVDLGRDPGEPAVDLGRQPDGTPESSPAGTAGDPPTHSPPGRTRRRRGAAVKLLVRIDYDTWLRGVAGEGETCELVGYGPVAVSAIRDLVENGDPFVAAILTKGRQLVGVAHLGRRPNAYQESALQWLYPSCAVRGCPAQARLESDHRVDWAQTHYTVLDLLDRLCHHHHALKTRENWALVAGAGKRDFVAPTDPRHPGRERQGSQGSQEEGVRAMTIS